MLTIRLTEAECRALIRRAEFSELLMEDLRVNSSYPKGQHPADIATGKLVAAMEHGELGPVSDYVRQQQFEQRRGI